jgi:hypothetical protein
MEEVVVLMVHHKVILDKLELLILEVVVEQDILMVQELVVLEEKELLY